MGKCNCASCKTKRALKSSRVAAGHTAAAFGRPLYQALARSTVASGAQSLYRPLRKGSIRLLSILSIDGDRVVCRLDTYPRKLAPKYDAVSYCWGNDRTATTISCNGSDLEVRRSLIVVLRHLAERPRPHRPLWIDAVSLNQADNNEKAIQVPLMDKVYTLATRTVVWLGEADADTDLAVDFMPYAVSHLTEGKVAAELESPEHNKQWEALRNLLQRPWFNRVWILQEALLSSTIEILCGHRSFTWSSLNQFLNTIDSHDLEVKLLSTGALSAAEMLNYPRQKIEFMEDTRTDIQDGRRLPLADLLYCFEGRGCGEPVDRVWALLGMLQKRFVAMIQQAGIIDYSDDGRKNYWKSYLGVMKVLYAFSPEKFQSTVFWGVSHAKHAALPSWCPDFDASRLYALFAMLRKHGAGFTDAGESTEIQMRLDPEHNTISVPGFVVDTVQNTTSSIANFSIMVGGDDKEAKASRAQRYLKWLEEARSLSYGAFGSSIWATGLFYQTLNAVDREEYNDYPEDWAKVHQALHDYLLMWTRRSSTAVDMDYTSPLLGVYAFDLEMACSGRKFFTTMGKRVGLGPPDMMVGDSVCVFLEEQSLYLLRKVDSANHGSHPTVQVEQLLGEDVSTTQYTLIGDTYVHDLMFGEAFTAPGRGPNQRFRII